MEYGDYEADIDEVIGKEFCDIPGSINGSWNTQLSMVVWKSMHGCHVNQCHVNQ